ncbi:GNAT family N-acetyltransferase [Caldibacillus lycopersici]|uniref:GNAT family N-acetyltransferase n=1 Tax=Perspicuibacillus lycopersici TaxID=1325689 RepID=A0AAE3LP77_9BACI|nr:GNAT family N-acetyltransferase [Perspicuibacillus lycopersici]MCU9614711.1 GNAT family N-acetyltransferase [Perspicuibacillus lycopersici]
MSNNKTTSMIKIERANIADREQIKHICRKGYLYTTKYFQNQQLVRQKIAEYYSAARITREIENVNTQWQGWVVARQNGKVIGAAGGGLITANTGGIFVLYLDLAERRKGIGTMLVNYITEQQRDAGAKLQFVRVLQSNQTAIHFYQSIGFQLKANTIDQENPEFSTYTLQRKI